MNIRKRSNDSSLPKFVQKDKNVFVIERTEPRETILQRVVRWWKNRKEITRAIGYPSIQARRQWWRRRWKSLRKKYLLRTNVSEDQSPDDAYRLRKLLEQCVDPEKDREEMLQDARDAVLAAQQRMLVKRDVKVSQLKQSLSEIDPIELEHARKRSEEFERISIENAKKREALNKRGPNV